MEIARTYGNSLSSLQPLGGTVTGVEGEHHQPVHVQPFWQVGAGGEGALGAQQPCSSCQYQPEDGQEMAGGGLGLDGGPPWGRQHPPLFPVHLKRV